MNSKFSFLITCFLPIFYFGQFGNLNIKPISLGYQINASIPEANLVADKSQILNLLSIENSSSISSIVIPAGVEFRDFKLLKILSNGDKVYVYRIKSEGALGLRIRFSHLEIGKGRITIYNEFSGQSLGSYFQKDIASNGELVSSLLKGDNAIIEYIEPYQFGSTNINIGAIDHFFRGVNASGGFGTSQACMVNSICPEANNFKLENLATCKIFVNSSSFTGYCSGTLMNNTNEDGAPIILTANHCMSKVDLSDLKHWEFHFFYHSISCSNPSSEPIPLILKGAKLLAQSGKEDGEKSSDFLLLQLLEPLPSGVEFTFMGWDRRDVVASGGICFHHPDGDIKKVSSFSGSTISSFKGLVSNTHLALLWNQMLSGNSVTQGGSSGSGLISQDKLLVGTLTGGGSHCNPQSYGPDYFGRLAYHWDKYGKQDNERVDVWLDPKGKGTATSLRSIRMSDVKSKVGETAKVLIKIYPNPASDILLIESAHKKLVVEFFDNLGQCRMICNNSKNGVNISSLNSGIYIIRIKDENETVLKLEKLVIQH